MKKSTQNFLLLGALGVGAYFLLRSKSAVAETSRVITPSSMPVSNQGFSDVASSLLGLFQGVKDQFTAKEQAEIQQSISGLESGNITNKSLVDTLNKLYSQGVTFQRTSSTVQKGVTATGGSGSSFSGQTLTGNIAKLATGNTVFIATKPSTTFANTTPATTRMSTSELISKYGLAER
jgi:hypothetical protein